MEEFKIQHKTVCDCGHQFIIQDINGLKRIAEDKFYGGAIKHYSDTVCPECGKQTRMFLKQKGQTYIVIDIATKETINQASNTKINENDTEVSTDNNEIKCTECGRPFKTKAGLTNHMKTHK